MINTWNHKGLKRFYEIGDTSGIQVIHQKRLKIILQRLNVAVRPEDMNTPGMRFHHLSGNYKGFYSVTVNKNWRIIYAFKEGNVILVDYLDYH
jgi:proteic killer suppression protein